MQRSPLVNNIVTWAKGGELREQYAKNINHCRGRPYYRRLALVGARQIYPPWPLARRYYHR